MSEQAGALVNSELQRASESVAQIPQRRL